MNDTAIRATHLSKKYRIGALKQRHNTLRDELVYGLKSLYPRRGGRPAAAAKRDTLWAINDVSFEVKRGEALAVIGRNGAGKSTLLKMLSRITEPSAGRCEIYGRLGSLLEVGTGFHGELTGRENVYLNGAILGMKRAEVERKFDEIVAFAEVEKFIDTPVKRYSSGMHVRLAFAVAAHLEPEILIVDEVLAVGDLSFQNKCLGRLGDVAREGRTVLFVSHNMGAVTNLCKTAMWIDQGSVKMRGDVASVASAYIKSQPSAAQNAANSWKRSGSGEARVVAVRLLDAHGDDCSAFLMGETLALELDILVEHSLPSMYVTIEVNRKEMGMSVLHMQNDDSGFEIERVSPGMRRFRVEIPNCLLYPTSYEIMLCLWDRNKVIDYVPAVVSFSMIQSDVTRRTTPLTLHRQAIYFAPTTWKDLSVDVSPL